MNIPASCVMEKTLYIVVGTFGSWLTALMCLSIQQRTAWRDKNINLLFSA